MKILLILLLCQSFSFGPAVLFQQSDYFTRCNGGGWADEESHFAKAMSKKSSELDPWEESNHTTLARKPDSELGSKMKSRPTNLSRNKSDHTPWEELDLIPKRF